MNGYIYGQVEQEKRWRVILAVNHIEYLKYENEQAGPWSGTFKGIYTSCCGDR